MAGLDPLILAGDFNIKPMDHCYDLITKGSLPEGSHAAPVFPEWETKADPDWKIELDRLEFFFGCVRIYVCAASTRTLLSFDGRERVVSVCV